MSNRGKKSEKATFKKDKISYSEKGLPCKFIGNRGNTKSTTSTGPKKSTTSTGPKKGKK